MSTQQYIRAQTLPAGVAPQRVAPQTAFLPADLPTIAQHMYALMLRNIASDGFLFKDPNSPGEFSMPGCVIAAPSFPGNTPGVNQDYVFNWTRDAAITALELAAAEIPDGPGGGSQPLIDYVRFAQICQTNAHPTMAHACFTIDGQSRDWTDQTDGPALQTVAILTAFDQLDVATQAIAIDVINKNIGFLLGVYQNETTNLWEETSGLSFFARSAQLRCFEALTANAYGIPVPPATAGAITWLQAALSAHWNGSYYVTLLALPAPGVATSPSKPPSSGYDPNIDIVCASVYGAVPVTDTKLLATMAKLRWQWADPAAPSLYPINIADQTLGIGPVLGRYPGDTYDGDMNDHVVGGHPWALCTCNFAEVYYKLSIEIAGSGLVPFDTLSAPFFQQIGVVADTSAADAVKALKTAAEAMLRAVIYHSDRLELSEQFDGTSGYEKSVRNLTWSYAAFLSAVRAGTGLSVRG